MPVLALGKPIEQGKPVILVESKLTAGKHRFALVVVNERGAESEASEVVVTVSKIPVLRQRVVLPVIRGTKASKETP